MRRIIGIVITLASVYCILFKLNVQTNNKQSKRSFIERYLSNWVVIRWLDCFWGNSLLATKRVTKNQKAANKAETVINKPSLTIKKPFIARALPIKKNRGNK